MQIPNNEEEIWAYNQTVDYVLKWFDIDLGTNKPNMHNNDASNSHLAAGY